ncbi:sulfotransferase [Sphingomonas sp.]|uniref:sulfotransferase family protein n=1 Tax=Sphingomonas sp. TaxID=28214 RepID=UPI002D7F19FC|nr:sulfotransferase [Sphingomonas sp.]HEU0045733.1 sulfotransferase [Sphingomonas sp.]
MIEDVYPSAAAESFQSARSSDPRRRRLRVADAALEWLWSKGLATRPPLDPAALLAATAASDLPDPSGWRHRLFLLCEALEQTARLTPLGRTMAYGQLAAALRDRVRLERLWARHPAILDQPLAPPIIIVGQMRSGSTRLQRLLARDPRLAATRFFESWNPVPRTLDRGWFDDRVWRARLGLALTRTLNPDFAAIHPTRWNAADEQIGWHAISIFGAAFETQWRVPAFTAEVESTDPTPVYREFRRLLQTVTWLRGDDGARAHVLKIPQFAQDLDAILRVFPDATILRLDRNPVPVVASSASLARNQMELQSTAVCPHWLGRETLRKVALRHERTEATLRRAAVPHLRIDYDAMTANWESEIGRVYDHLRLPLTAAVHMAMQEELDRSRRHQLHRHRYALADYGLTAGQVQAAMAMREQCAA